MCVVVQDLMEDDSPVLAKWPNPREVPLLLRCWSHAKSRLNKASKAVPIAMASGCSIVPFYELLNHSTEPNCERDQILDDILELQIGPEQV